MGKVRILQLLTHNKGFQPKGYGTGAYVDHMADAIRMSGNELLEFTIDIDGKNLDELSKIECDVLFFHTLPTGTNPLRQKIYDVVKSMPCKKVGFINDHSPKALTDMFGDYLKNVDILNIFDKICTFDNTTPVWREIEKTIGKENADKKYFHMVHPYNFKLEPKDWVALKDKKKRIMYMGRNAAWKDPMRLLRNRWTFLEKGIELEFRGLIDKNNELDGIVNLKYEFNHKGKAIGHSRVVTHIDNLWYNKHDLPYDDYLLDFERNGEIFWFERYDYAKLVPVIQHTMFGADFFHLADWHWTGNNLEYVQMEMIENGTVLLHDYGTAVTNKFNGKTLIELNAVLPMSKLGDNAEVVSAQCDYLSNNEKAYNDMRTAAYECIKTYTDPVKVLNDIITAL